MPSDASHWSQGYVADLGYTYGYYRELNPALQRLIAVNRRQQPLDLSRPFSYCELGFGQGYGLNLLAACYPQAQFYGTDFNPTHLLQAQSLAAAAGLGNLHLYEDGFAEFGDRPELPQFDIIALHGIWTWIDPPTRAHVIAFLQKKLKPGGLVYISYNAYPGWAAMRPVRDFMHRIAPVGSGTTLERLQKALAFLKEMQADNKSGYFLANPAVAQRFEKILEQPQNYLAHEFMNAHWEPSYFSEVAEAMGRAKLDFFASANVADQVDVTQHVESQRQFLAGIADPVLRESSRDFLSNQQFRRDLFLRGAQPSAPTDQGAAAGETRFLLTVDPATLDSKQKFPVGEVTLQEEIYRPIWQRLAEGPVSLAELAELPEIKPRGVSAAWQACLVTVGLGKGEPCPPAPDMAARQAACRALNRAIMQQSRLDDRLKFLAAPVTAAAYVVPRLHQLFILAEQEGQADPALATWETLSAQGQKLMRKGKALDSAEDNLAELRREFAGYETAGRPIYRRLGIID